MSNSETPETAEETPTPGNPLPSAEEVALQPLPLPAHLSKGERIGLVLINLLTALAVVTALLLAAHRFLLRDAVNPNAAVAMGGEAEAASIATEAPSEVTLSAAMPLPALETNITRKVLLHTTIPNRPRTDVITYTVQSGDSLFSIASQFGIKPETVLWGNYETLQNNPHLLKVGQVLNILPVDGTYYQWNEGDRLSQVAEFFKVDPQAILSYPGNHLDLTQANSDNPGIEPGTWIIVPGGKRALVDWGPPAITRSNPASARFYGPGFCGAIYEGAVGTGTFLWPTTEHFISGNPYDPSFHPAIDIAGQLGNPVYATDSGVIVFAGWSNFGYGNLVVIDHGNGWQSAYAHLNSISVLCGQSVFQGSTIGTLGSTGNSTGPHLHFELIYNSAKLNPLDFVR
jgi:murein DD-endopeptidase MepM/ murein hydrolase activator NlpD